MRRYLIVVVAFLATGCGSSPATPSAPQIPNVAGVWRGSMVTSSVSGGECVGATLQSSVGASGAFTYAIQQNGSSLSGTYTDTDTAISCSFTGSASGTSMVLNYSACSINSFRGLRCSNGAIRDVVIFAGSDSETITGNQLAGTSSQSWNVFVSGGGVGVGIMTVQLRVTASRQ